jgi:hypothetical protein
MIDCVFQEWRRCLTRGADLDGKNMSSKPSHLVSAVWPLHDDRPCFRVIIEHRVPEDHQLIFGGKGRSGRPTLLDPDVMSLDCQNLRLPTSGNGSKSALYVAF